MKRNLIGIVVLALLASLGFAQSSMFFAKVSLLEVILPTVMLEVKIPVVDEYGLLARAGLNYPFVGLGEAYLFWTPMGQDHWTWALGGGLVGGFSGSIPPSPVWFIAGGFEYAWDFSQWTRGSIELGAMYPWYYSNGNQRWQTFQLPLPILRFSLIFPLR